MLPPSDACSPPAPKGSKVEFQIGLQGAIVVNGMLAGKVDIGYVGDMPGIVSTSHGVMSNREAKKKGVGGEVICTLW